MAVTSDIIASWHSPRRVMQAHLTRGRSEPWVFSLLVTFLLIVFVSQWPGASRASFYQPEVPIAQRLIATALGLMATIPFWYLLAAVGHLIAKALGGQGDYYGGRLALFWSLVAIGPAMLLQGLVAGLIGPGPALTLVSSIAGLAFLGFWFVNLKETER